MQHTVDTVEPIPLSTFTGQPGLQVAYIPNHAQGDINHPDVELGFVTGWNHSQSAAFCRFFYKNSPLLRTLANSELTPLDNLYVWTHTNQDVIQGWLRTLGYA